MISMATNKKMPEMLTEEANNLNTAGQGTLALKFVKCPAQSAFSRQFIIIIAVFNDGKRYEYVTVFVAMCFMEIVASLQKLDSSNF